ncbi:trimeric LpxA-like protein [Wallemia mellicola]|uniref:Trimeric LpxA-like protein n=1 Tax=Wallemia mellicola TaxID=1708541 RepID=A0A4T0R9F8_9BASI|nr:trimeric LpxA-like protein [Wallemia mellicola]
MPLTAEEFMQKLKSKYTSPHFQKALNGEAYKSLEDTEMVKVKKRARQLTHKYNIQLPPVEYQEGMSSLKNLPEIYGSEEHYKTLSELFDKPIEECKTLYIETIQVDHGVFINFEGCKLHKEINFYANYGLVILDCSAVHIGNGCSFGPSVHIYSAGHSTDVEERKKDVQRANPVTIGRDCWIGGHVVSLFLHCFDKHSQSCRALSHHAQLEMVSEFILTLFAYTILGVTVAAGAVVRGNVPANVVVAGNPARIIKHLKGPQVLA